MIEAVEARKVSRGTLVQGRYVMVRQSRLVVAKFGLARCGCGTAVVVWYVEFGRVEVW